MTERTFRLLAGVSLWLALWYFAYTADYRPIFVFIGLMVFEGVTNWRIPKLLSRIRYGSGYQETISNQGRIARFSFFEAERMLRLVVASMLLIAHFYFHDTLWFLPWFVTGMLVLAGITNICPMVMFFRSLGFR